MTILVESSNDISTDLNSRIQSRNCRTQVHGEDQSRSITISVSGTDCGVKRGRKRGAKDGDGSERRYIETRARISIVMIISFHGIVNEKLRTNLHDQHRGRLGMYNPEQNHLQWAPLFPFFSRLVAADLRDPKIKYPEILFGCRVYLLQ